jgi:superfamily I DNA and/or RNA helicase/serine/threonine protein kinase
LLVLGKYELLEGESSGGQSTVLAARDIRDGKRVAVKVLKGLGEGNERAISQDLYELELRILKKLQGIENVIQLLDYGFDLSMDQNVLVMEWMEVSLADRLAQIQNVISEENWVKFSRNLINGVMKAHGRSIAHRDIKPANIMFRTNAPSDWDCVLIDFGISKFIGDEDLDVNLTMREYRTPAYASPNYLEEEDFTRDVFGLTAVMVRLRDVRDFDARYTVQDSLRKLRENPNINQKHIAVLEVGADPDYRRRFKTIREFYGELSGQNDPDSRGKLAKTFTLRLSPEAKDQLRELQSGEASREYAVLQELLREQIYLRLPKDSDHSQTSDRFTLQVGFLELKCKGPAPDSNQPHAIWVRDMKEIEQSEMEFKVSRSKAVPQIKFTFFLDSGLSTASRERLATYADYAKLVANPNRPAELKLDDKIASKVSKWESILDAKEEYILGTGAKTSFELVDVQYRSLNLRPIDSQEGLFAPQSTWGLEGVSGIQLVLDFQDQDGTLAFTANKDVRNFPKRGVIYPTLGDNAPSFRRQKQALQSIKDNGESLGNWVQVVVDPSYARVHEGLAAIEYYDQQLDTAKRSAIGVALQAEDVALIQGPPGTGKTSFIVELIRQFSNQGAVFNRILLVSQTHIAVDNAIERLHRAGFESILRVGRDERVSPETKHLLIDQRLGEWQSKVENSSSKFLDVLITNMGCDPNQISCLALLDRLKETKQQAETVLPAAQVEDSTTFSQQVEQLFEDTGLARNQDSFADYESLDLDYKELIGDLQGYGYAREQIMAWDSEMVSAEFNSKLRSHPQMSRAWALAEVQAKWVRLFRADEHLKKTYVSRTQVIAGTCIGFLGDQYARNMEFDLCIIDEASKATATEILVPMARSRKTVLVGDTNQLPPTQEQLTRDPVLMAKYDLTIEDVEVTLFDSLAEGLPQSSQIMLTRQYRMLPVIGEMISKVFYKGKVDSEPKEIPKWVSDSWGHPLKFIDTSLVEANHHDEVGTSIRNRLEAKLAVDQVAQLLAKLSFTGVDVQRLRIVILVPYVAQVTEVKHVLIRQKVGASQVEVLTFDSAQGIECDFAVVTATRSLQTSSLGGSQTSKFGFIARSNWKRINVGLSRARYGLAIIGNRSFLREGSGFQAVIEYLEATDAEITSASTSAEAETNG